MADIPYLSTRCPVCGDNGSMPPVSGNASIGRHRTKLGALDDEVYIVMYKCTNQNCMGAAVGYYTFKKSNWRLLRYVPSYERYLVDESVPERARQWLQEANDTKKAPAACVMTASRGVEAMLAEKGYANRKDSLKKRIDQAVEDQLLPKIMGQMAHETREFAREGHTDDDPQSLPDKDDAEHVLIYANRLAEWLPCGWSTLSLPERPVRRSRPRSSAIVTLASGMRTRPVVHMGKPV